MPYRLELTWIAHAKRWRKRYQGQTYYLKTACNGRKDREGYLAALQEWQRLKAFLDGLGPSPYTERGVLIPEGQTAVMAYAPSPALVQPSGQTQAVNGHARKSVAFEPASPPANSPFILGVGIGGFNPELVVKNGPNNPHLGERRIRVLADTWLEYRHKLAERGELSLKQWADDKAKLQVFSDFLLANFPTALFIDQIDAPILNLYRDKQWEFVEHAKAEHRISKATLKKRLDTLAKWLNWLVDQNILAELPKDLRTFGRVKLDKPKPVFWSVDEVKKLADLATERTRLYLILALNCGYTQKDIATLEASMVDWQTGIVTRDRHKTGVASKAKLWPSTLALLAKHRSKKTSGPLLLGESGKPLYAEQVNENGKLISIDNIRLAFDRLLKRAELTDGRSFKHLRKTSANLIEQSAPHLTELFLAHAEKGTKRFYVEQQFQELFKHTDKLEGIFGFNKAH